MGILLPLFFFLRMDVLCSCCSLATRNLFIWSGITITNSIAIALQTTIQTKKNVQVLYMYSVRSRKSRWHLKMTQFPPPLRDHLRRDMYLKLGTFFTKPENMLNNYNSCIHLLEIPKYLLIQAAIRY